MINWQLSKQGIRWPVSLDRIAGSGVDPSRSSIFFWSYPRWQVTSFQMIAGSSLIVFYFIWNMFCFCAAQLKYWFKTDLGCENPASYYRRGRQLLLTLLTMVTRWSRSTSNFYALIGQNWQVSSCGKFMQHLESCLLWQLKLTEFCVNLWCFFNCFFPLDAQNEIQLLSGVFCYSWLAGAHQMEPPSPLISEPKTN